MKAYLKLIAIASIFAFALTACKNAPSPQDTSPTKAAKCNALRARMMQFGNQNNTSNAIQDTEQQNWQQTYEDECQ